MSTIDEKAFFIAIVQILLGLRYKLKSIDRDIDDLIRIIARMHNLDVKLEEPAHIG